MPLVNIKMLKGRTKEQKQKLAEVISKDVAEICKTKIESVWVIIEEVDGENWATAGTLLADKR